jgi:AraC-like DNA-binding protein
MDPLSDVLSLLKPRSQLCAGLDAAGPWSFLFPAHEGIKFTAVLRGTCWGIAEGRDQPIRFDEGDCFLLNSGRRFVLASDPALPPGDSEAVIEAAARDDIAIHNGGGEVFLISGRFAFSSRHAPVLFEALPSIIHVPRASAEAEVLRWSLDQLGSELRHPQPGGTLVSVYLVHLMLVQVLRLHLVSASADLPTGWFRALSDQRISSAVGAIHAEPARRWTLEELARIAGVSRTIFALPTASAAFQIFSNDEFTHGYRFKNIVKQLSYSLSTASVIILEQHRMAVHETRLNEFANPFNPVFQNTLDTMTRAFEALGNGAADARNLALAELARVAAHQASMSVLDGFHLMIGLALLGGAIALVQRQIR